MLAGDPLVTATGDPYVSGSGDPQVSDGADNSCCCGTWYSHAYNCVTDEYAGFDVPTASAASFDPVFRVGFGCFYTPGSPDTQVPGTIVTAPDEVFADCETCLPECEDLTFDSPFTVAISGVSFCECATSITTVNSLRINSAAINASHVFAVSNSPLTTLVSIACDADWYTGLTGIYSNCSDEPEDYECTTKYSDHATVECQIIGGNGYVCAYCNYADPPSEDCAPGTVPWIGFWCVTCEDGELIVGSNLVGCSVEDEEWDCDPISVSGDSGGAYGGTVSIIPPSP
jgi:hypothetical protein